MTKNLIERFRLKIAALQSVENECKKAVDAARLMLATIETTRVSAQHISDNPDLTAIISRQIGEAQRLVMCERDKLSLIQGRIQQCQEFITEERDIRDLEDAIDRLRTVVDFPKIEAAKNA